MKLGEEIKVMYLFSSGRLLVVQNSLGEPVVVTYDAPALCCHI